MAVKAKKQTAAPAAAVEASPLEIFTRCVRLDDSLREVAGDQEHSILALPAAKLLFAVKPLCDGRYVRYKEAEQACAELRLGSISTWRLATRAELLLLVKLDRYGPALDRVALPHTPSGWHWSSSVVAGNRDYQWGVYFYGGSTGVYHRRYDDGYVLAVCDGVPASPGQ